MLLSLYHLKLCLIYLIQGCMESSTRKTLNWMGFANGLFYTVWWRAGNCTVVTIITNFWFFNLVYCWYICDSWTYPHEIKTVSKYQFWDLYKKKRKEWKGELKKNPSKNAMADKLNANGFGHYCCIKQNIEQTGKHMDLETSLETPLFVFSNVLGLSKLWQNCAIVTVSTMMLHVLYVPPIPTLHSQASKILSVLSVNEWKTKLDRTFPGVSSSN